VLATKYNGILARRARHLQVKQDWPCLCQRDWRFVAEFLKEWDEPLIKGGSAFHYCGRAEDWMKRQENMNDLKIFRSLQLEGAPL
jgi:hypothetical protein